jgi:hypothetical protein
MFQLTCHNIHNICRQQRQASVVRIHLKIFYRSVDGPFSIGDVTQCESTLSQSNCVLLCYCIPNLFHHFCGSHCCLQKFFWDVTASSYHLNLEVAESFKAQTARFHTRRIVIVIHVSHSGSDDRLLRDLVEG